MKDEIIQSLLGKLVPEEILESFEITDVDDKAETRCIITLTEKETCKPRTDEELAKDGYMNIKDIQHLPAAGKRMTLRLRRRRWKSLKDRNKTYFNNYTYTEDGCKITHQYGAFLKEKGLKEPI